MEAALARLEATRPRLPPPGAPMPASMPPGRWRMRPARDWDLFRLTEALNYHLRPTPVAMIKAARVPADWHARFSAIERHYVFRLIARRAPLTHEAGLVWQVKAAAGRGRDARRRGALVGRHDFTTFRASSARRKARSRRSTRSPSPNARAITGRRSASSCARGPSCTTRCARSSARWNGSAPGPGRRRRWRRRWRPATAPPAGRSARRGGYTCTMCATPAGFRGRIGQRGRCPRACRRPPRYFSPR